MSFDLNKHVHRLLMDEPFFAILSRQIEKRKGTVQFWLKNCAPPSRRLSRGSRSLAREFSKPTHPQPYI